jgi:hypothetical protein
MKIAYFVHDLADAAVHRRVRMMRGFADLIVVGFHRSGGRVPDISGVTTVDLGRTVDARLAHRVTAVLRAATHVVRQPGLQDTTVFIARQLEMLCLAALARNRIAPAAPLVFECLDIHRLMLSPQPVGMGLRALEGWLLRSCSLLIVSSPAFITSHFSRYGSALPRHLLLENKVWAEDVSADARSQISQLRTDGPLPQRPWRIGWFGIIRCRRSLQLLADLVTRQPGAVEVVIRGRPKRNVIPEFDRVVASTPGLNFLGEYDRHTQLAAIYSDVHFAWAIDFYEAGQNSDWLLPNRLYEGALYGAVPLALESVETGRWLKARGCGVRLQDTANQSLDQALLAYFRSLDAAQYAAARHAMAQVPLSDLLDDEAACDRFGAVLAALPRRCGNEPNNTAVRDHRGPGVERGTLYRSVPDIASGPG